MNIEIKNEVNAEFLVKLHCYFRFSTCNIYYILE